MVLPSIRQSPLLTTQPDMACGERTIPGTIDNIALSTPDKIWARYPATPDDFQEGIFQDVTFSSLANAVNNMAWLLDASFPQRGPLDTLAYSGPSDIRYYIVACAACKCSMKVIDTFYNFKMKHSVKLIPGIVLISKEQLGRSFISHRREPLYSIATPSGSLFRRQHGEGFAYAKTAHR